MAGRLIGICGGFQMLGTRIRDPLGLEGDPGDAPGLGLLDLDTRLLPEKVLAKVSGRLQLEDAEVGGYEIHAGVTSGAALERPLMHLTCARGERPDGAVSEDGRILGTYLHGLFESPAAASALLRWAGLSVHETPDYRAMREAALERLADSLEQHLDMERIEHILHGAASNEEIEPLLRPRLAECSGGAARAAIRCGAWPCPRRHLPEGAFVPRACAMPDRSGRPVFPGARDRPRPPCLSHGRSSRTRLVLVVVDSVRDFGTSASTAESFARSGMRRLPPASREMLDLEARADAHIELLRLRGPEPALGEVAGRCRCSGVDDGLGTRADCIDKHRVDLALSAGRHAAERAKLAGVERWSDGRRSSTTRPAGASRARPGSETPRHRRLTVSVGLSRPISPGAILTISWAARGIPRSPHWSVSPSRGHRSVSRFACRVRPARLSRAWQFF
jgi:hypothetical protein